MSLEDNKALVLRGFEEFIVKGNLAAADELLVPNFVAHAPGFPPLQGIEAYKQFLTIYLSALSDRQADVQDVSAEGDRVAVRITYQGTHTGALMGIPPTGKRVMITGMCFFQVANGKLLEQWINNDDLGLMQQLGVVPPPQ